MTPWEELRKALRLIKDRLGSLDWVSRDAGFNPVQIEKFVGGDDSELNDTEVRYLLDWYNLGGPT